MKQKTGRGSGWRCLLAALLLVSLVAGLAPAGSAATAYSINGKTVRWNDFSSSPNDCWSYASNLYRKIWGTWISYFFEDRSNSLRNLKDSELTLTAEHLRDYVSNAALGSCLRICSRAYLHGTDGWGHSQIIVQKDSRGFTVFEGGISAYPYCRERYYTWNSYLRSFGSRYAYIKYIKWPNAPTYQPAVLPKNASVSTDRATYHPNESVSITPFASGATGYNLSVWHGTPGQGERVYGRYDNFTGSTVFSPTQTGLYTVRASCINRAGFVDAECSFYVLPLSYRVTFDANGGQLAQEAAESHAINGFDRPRGDGELIAYTCSGQKVWTDSNGVEVAVDRSGRVTEKRLYCEQTQLTVPTDGIVLSGSIGSASHGGAFVFGLQVGDYVSYQMDTAEATRYASKNAYLAAQKRVAPGDVYGELPTPVRIGYTFAGWYTDPTSGVRITSETPVSLTAAQTLFAHWEAEASHSYTQAVVAPTCTQRGYTLHTCACGDFYRYSYVNALGHDFAFGTCIRCGEVDPAALCDGEAHCPAANFSDMPAASGWAHRGLDFCISRGLLTGTSDTAISPELAVTRAMLVTILYRLEGRPETEAGNPFLDVENGRWFTAPVIWAAENGIVSGTGSLRFQPNASVTREQIALMLRSYARYKGYDTSVSADLSVYPDAGRASSWAKDALSWAVAEGLISGAASGGLEYLRPGNDASRAQAAAILMRFVAKVIGE